MGAEKRIRIGICKANTELEGGDDDEGPSVNKSSINTELSHRCPEEQNSIIKQWRQKWLMVREVEGSILLPGFAQ